MYSRNYVDVLYNYGKGARYPRIISIPDAACLCGGTCMYMYEKQLGRIPSIPGYSAFQTLCVWRATMYGAGQFGRIPSIP